MSSGFVVYFGITIFGDETVKEPRGALFYMGPRFGPFCVLLLENE